jgi:hypothetical protein
MDPTVKTDLINSQNRPTNNEQPNHQTIFKIRTTNDKLLSTFPSSKYNCGNSYASRQQNPRVCHWMHCFWHRITSSVWILGIDLTMALPNNTTKKARQIWKKYLSNLLTNLNNQKRQLGPWNDQLHAQTTRKSITHTTYILQRKNTGYLRYSPIQSRTRNSHQFRPTAVIQHLVKTTNLPITPHVIQLTVTPYKYTYMPTTIWLG